MTGRGSILMRAQSEFETNKKGDRQAIVVTEIRIRSNKAKLIERIAAGAREDDRGHFGSSRRIGSRRHAIVIELERAEVPEVMLNNLYEQRQLQ